MIFQFLEQDSTPNAFTIGMGQLIRQAREEKGYSQEYIAKTIQRRRASISNMENGKMIVDAITLTMLAELLEKPITYFIPEKYRYRLADEANLTMEERQLLIQFRRIKNNDNKRLALAQIHTIADLYSGDDN